MNKERTIIAIDLKSFYASVECIKRGLDPLYTNLVVANIERTEKTICLAVSPSLKSYGIGGRARLYEVAKNVKEINKKIARGRKNLKESFFYNELKNNPDLLVSYIVAKPRMALYIDYSTKIYKIYLKYFAPEDMHIYSIDEVFIDATSYLNIYHTNGIELAKKIINEILIDTGITATAGVGTNMYLAKVAMDIVAKHQKADENGISVAFLDEKLYRKLLWDHRPLTDFWRIGRGIQNRLHNLGIETMGELARLSLENDSLLYKTFGINAELIIDHAWGYEPCEISDIKKYKPTSNSISTGQVLDKPYNYNGTKLLVKEMVDNLCLELVERNVVTNKLFLTIGYDISCVNGDYEGEVIYDCYGRKIPKYAHGTIVTEIYTSSNTLINKKVLSLYERIINKSLNVRRINIGANIIQDNGEYNKIKIQQFNIFDDIENTLKKEELLNKELEKDKKIQNSILTLKKKYGKNTVLKGMNLEEGAKTVERNKQIGGHEA